MPMLFKKELLVTQDVEYYHKCMAILKENKIPFTQRIIYSESRFNLTNKSLRKPYYYIFVSKNYMKDALYLIHQE